MSKHTPGPWKKQKFGNSYEIFACDDVQSYIAGVNLDNPDNKANAQLIAAAPELLEVIEKAYFALDYFFNTNINMEEFKYKNQGMEKELLRVIKKAKGDE